MNLFRCGEFTAHSGAVLPWKVECDALTADDWACLAAIIAERVSFYTVAGVLMGGLALANALRQHRREDGRYALLVDDVLTTGRSMREYRERFPQPAHVLGVVVFCRLPAAPEPWIKALWCAPSWTDERDSSAR